MEQAEKDEQAQSADGARDVGAEGKTRPFGRRIDCAPEPDEKRASTINARGVGVRRTDGRGIRREALT